MNDFESSFNEQGFELVKSIYSTQEITNIIQCIENKEKKGANYRQSKDLFAIRNFLKEFPELHPLVFTPKLKELIHQVGGVGAFVIKSIYFDKPKFSNWYVTWHQDLMIQVKEKVEMNGFSSWTYKNQEYAVLPPLNILENIFTLRIHLDNTTQDNGALKVIPKSHLNGIVRKNEQRISEENAIFCECEQGDVMLMKPLTFHASHKTTNQQQRRVIHIEFSSINLPNGLVWREKQNCF